MVVLVITNILCWFVLVFTNTLCCVCTRIHAGAQKGCRRCWWIPVHYTLQLSRFFSGVTHDLTFSPAVSWRAGGDGWLAIMPEPKKSLNDGAHGAGQLINQIGPDALRARESRRNPSWRRNNHLYLSRQMITRWLCDRLPLSQSWRNNNMER